MQSQAAGQPSTPSPSTRQSAGREAVEGQTPFVPDYELLCRIGFGAYGDVWLARSTLGAYRAIKVVSRRSFEHDQPFEREFKGIQRFEPISLTHESQVKILHVGRNEEAGYFYYVMELADDAGVERSNGAVEQRSNGPARSTQHSNAPALLHPSSYVPRTLKHELQTRGRLPVDECVQIGLALTTALAHLHGHGLVHRDVKPSNIIFINGVPKLADIGLVADVEATRSFVGTEGFIPPEGPGTVSADLYSLGKVLYEISMGRGRLDFPALPVHWDDLPEDEQMRLREFNEVLVKACESDAAKRYGTARQMHTDLELLHRGRSVKQKRSAEQRWVLVRKLAVAAAVAALLLTALPFLKGSKHGHQPNPEAARLYELGRWYYNQLTPEDHAKAFTYLTRAIQKDPEFVQPYGELIGLYVWCVMPGITNASERMEHTLEIAEKLKAIDPNLAERHMALSWCRYMERDWRGAEDEIVKAVTLKPGLALAHEVYCFYLAMLGRTKEAHREGQLAVEIEPSDSRRAAAIVAAWAFMSERRYDGAIEQLRRVLELDKNFPQGHSYLGDCYQAQSNYVAAIEEFKTGDLLSAPESDKPYLNAVYTALRQAYDTQGERGYWEKWIELIREDEARPSETGIFSSPDIAGCYAKLGQKDKALDEMEKQFYRPNYSQRFKWDALYDPLHNEPRFKALLKQAGLDK